MSSNPPATGATQRDIARLLDLSRSTVAFALNPNHQHKLQRGTVELVRQKAEELNYHPRREAQILRQGRSRSIGVVFRTPIYHAQHEGASRLAQVALEGGYQPTAIDLQWFNRDVGAARRHLLDSSPDGVILNNLRGEEAKDWECFLHQRNIPVVIIGEVIEGENASVIIGADRLSAFRELTQHHLDSGSRDIALILPHRTEPGIKLLPPRALLLHRLQGFREAIETADGVLDGSKEVCRIFRLPPPKGGISKETVRGTVLYLNLDDHEAGNVFKVGYDYVMKAYKAGRLPESLVCSNDDIAAGVITAAIELEIPIPGRLKVSGADDASFSAYSGVPITTIRPPTQRMVQVAIDELMSRMERRDASFNPRQIVMPYELIVRRSTVRPAPARSGAGRKKAASAPA